MNFPAHKGAEGERIAKEYLEGIGLTFVTANWKCKVGEIDLIFTDGDVRVLVEVRTRSKTTFGNGDETVFIQKQKKLIRAAKYYQQKENYWGDIRFDVVSIILDAGITPTITHIPDAFDTGSAW